MLYPCFSLAIRMYSSTGIIRKKTGSKEGKETLSAGENEEIQGKKKSKKTKKPQQYGGKEAQVERGDKKMDEKEKKQTRKRNYKETGER